MTENDEVKNEYGFAAGSLKFKKFRELYENIAGRATNGQKIPCSLLKDEKAVMTFPIVYEIDPLQGRNRFRLEWEPMQLNQFNSLVGLPDEIKKEFPKFQLVGSVAKFASDASGPGQKYYGYLNASEL